MHHQALVARGQRVSVSQSGSLRDQGLDDALELVWRQALQLREEGGGVGAGVRDGGPAVRLAA